MGGDRADAVQVLRGDEASWARVMEAARTGSLFATRRAVVVRGADALKGEGDELGAYLDDPSPEALLVFMAARPDKRRTVWKRLLERARVHTAEPLRGRAARAFVADQVRRRQLPLREDGLEELFEQVGQDLRRLMGELDKLEAFASVNGPRFYGLPLNEGTVTLERAETRVPDIIDGVVPFHAGETLRWRLLARA